VSEYNQEAVGAAIAASASKAMYAGGGVAGTGVMLDSQFFGLVGLLIAIAGFAVNLYYKRQEHSLKREENARQEAEHRARMGLYE
jgi:hypothetical protein